MGGMDSPPADETGDVDAASAVDCASEKGLVQRVAPIREALGIEEGVSIPACIAKANELMGLQVMSRVKISMKTIG